MRGSTLVAEDGSTADADALVFATGFDLTATLGSMAVTGLGGADLVAEMEGQPASLLGLGHASFPNLAFIVGPNTGVCVFVRNAVAESVLSAIRIDPRVHALSHSCACTATPCPARAAASPLRQAWAATASCS